MTTTQKILLYHECIEFNSDFSLLNLDGFSEEDI